MIWPLEIIKKLLCTLGIIYLGVLAMGIINYLVFLVLRLFNGAYGNMGLYMIGELFGIAAMGLICYFGIRWLWKKLDIKSFKKKE